MYINRVPLSVLVTRTIDYSFFKCKVVPLFTNSAWRYPKHYCGWFWLRSISLSLALSLHSFSSAQHFSVTRDEWLVCTICCHVPLLPPPLPTRLPSCVCCIQSLGSLLSCRWDCPELWKPTTPWEACRGRCGQRFRVLSRAAEGWPSWRKRYVNIWMNGRIDGWTDGLFDEQNRVPRMFRNKRGTTGIWR